MEDLQKKISDLLSDPSSMEQIKALSGMLGMANHTEEKPKKENTAALAGLGSVIPNMGNPEMLGTVMKLAPLLGSMNQENESTRLLMALKPFMSSQRQRKIDEAIRLMGLMRMLPMLKSMGAEF